MSIESASGVRYGDTTAGSAYQEVFTDLYLERIIDVRNNSNPLLSLIEENMDPQRISGKTVLYPVHSTRSTGSNAIHAGGDLPDPGTQGYDRYKYPWQLYYGRVKVGGVAMMSSDSQDAAWVAVLDQEMKGLEDDVARQYNRMLHNDGSGRVAEISATANSATQTVRLNSGIEGNTTSGMNAHYFMRTGKAYAVVGRGTTNTLRSVVTLNSKSGTNSVTFNSTVNATAGDWIVEISADDASYTTTAALEHSGFQGEMMGFAGIFSDQNVDNGSGIDAGDIYNGGAGDGTNASGTAFQGVAVSGNSWNQCTVNSASSARPLTLDLIQSTVSDAEEANNTRIDGGLVPYKVYNQLTSLVYPDRRYTDSGTQNFSAGHQGSISYNNIEFYKDRDCYPNRMYLPDLSQLVHFKVKELHWADEDGAILHRLPNKDDFQATLRGAGTLGTWCRERVGALITDIST